MSKEEKLNTTSNDKEKEKTKSEFESELSKIGAVLIERRTERKGDDFSVRYDLSKLQNLNIKSEEEKNDIKNLTKNILLSSHFSYIFYAFSKILGYLKSLFLYNIFYFIIMKIIFKLMNSKDSQKFQSKAPLWKKLIAFNLPDLLLIFYYHKRNLTKINTALYALFTFLNEKIIYAFNSDKSKNYLCQIDQNNFNIYLMKKGQKNIDEDSIIYIHNPEILEEDTFYKSVISYPNANFEYFNFNNLTQAETEMYEDIFTFINEVEKKIKEECQLYNSLGTVTSNLSYNNLSNYNIRYGLSFKLFSFIILEIVLTRITKRKRRKFLLEEKLRIFNEKNMKKGYFLVVNEYVILLFKIKDEYKSFEKSYDILSQKCKSFLEGYFEKAERII